MLKSIPIARISNFCMFLAYLSIDFKHVVLSRLYELLGLQYIVGKFQIFSFQPNLNWNKIQLVAPNMSKTVHEGIV
jgi:hypothetical protein